MLFNITKLIDVAKARSTESGKELVDVLVYLAEFCELVGRCLRAGLTYRDNFACEAKTISLVHNTAQIVSVSSNRVVTGISLLKSILGTELVMLDSFGWHYTANGEVEVKAKFDGSPTAAISCDVVLYF